MLRSETSELLAGFEKRMKFINIVKCILDYKYPDDIKKMIPDKEILDNIVIAVLVFIKDRTLGTDSSCTLGDVERFLESLVPVLPQYNIDAPALAEYVVVDMLQHGGLLSEYLTYFSKDETFAKMPIRLIVEDKGTYHLTDDAFDFLFRTKEIESELDYSVTRFKMKEYLKRNNYAEALDQSRELVNRIRNMKTSMDDFLVRCRENISKITVDQYESIILRIRSLLESEYKELEEIKANARERAEKLSEAQGSGIDAEETRKNRMALNEIVSNISQTIEEQRSLINKKDSLSDSYSVLLRDSFVVNRFERMNFEKDLLSPLRRMGDTLGDAAMFLLFPLVKPSFENVFNIENFYAPMGKMSEDETEEGDDMTEAEDDGTNLIQIRNERFYNIVFSFFRFVTKKHSFSAEEYIESLTMSELCDYCEENALPNVLLSFYSMQSLNIEEWKKETDIIIEPLGDFELAWCLSKIPEEYLNMKEIRVTKKDKPCQFLVRRDGKEYQIDLTDFDVEVTV